MNHKKKVYRNLLLPKSMVEELTKHTKGKTLQNCYYILYIITHGFNKHDYMNFQSFRPIPNKRLFKMLGSGYITPLNILLFNGIIDRTEKFSASNCFRYRIAPSYYCEKEYIKVKFSYYQKTDNTEQYENDVHELRAFIKNFRLLDIPFDELYAKIDSKVDELSINDYKTDDQVEWSYKKMDVTEIDEDWLFTTLKRLTKQEALLIADQKNKLIVNDGQKICMVDPEYFILEQKNFTKLAWTASVDNLQEESTLYGKRNQTNNRLDTNFTNFSKELYDIILTHNQMGESDLMNSQPAILSHILRKEGVQGDDVELFHHLTNNDGFYEYFIKDGMERNDAKQMIFQVFFGKDRVDNPMTKRFRKIFPNVSRYISAYKWEQGDNSFANLLQRFESNLFIDKIYYDLLEQGITVFSKHDSISFFIKDREAVAQIIDKHFQSIGFSGKIRTEYKIKTAA